MTVTNNQTVNALVIQSGANVVVNGSSITLTVNGNYHNKGGNINAVNGATVIFNGNAYNASNKRITNTSSFKVKSGIKMP